MVTEIKLVVLVVVVGYLWKRSSCRKTIKLSKITSQDRGLHPKEGVSPLRRGLEMLVGKLELNPSGKSGRDS